MTHSNQQEALFEITTPDEGVGYSAAMAYQIADITYRQLDYWDRTKLVKPSIRGAAGSGSQRLYSFRDILVLKIVKSLLDTGISLQKIREAVLNLEDFGTEDLAGVTLVSDGKTVYACREANEVIDLLAGGQGVFGIAIPGLVKELNGTITAFPSEPAAARASQETGTLPMDELAARRQRRQA